MPLKNLVTLLLLFVLAEANSQTAKRTVDSTRTAAVEVVVNDPANKPRKGEEIVFISATGKQRFIGRTDAKGTTSVRLPVGNSYMVTVKALADSNEYGSLSIPQLKQGESFTAPFKVKIVYEPARSFTLDNVHFDNNKATLRPESFKELNELAEYLKWREDDRIEIGGHTDNVGKDEENVALSERRANAVREYVIKKGISPQRVVAKGYGATQPTADNSNEEGRQKNRRTEVKLLQ